MSHSNEALPIIFLDKWRSSGISCVYDALTTLINRSYVGMNSVTFSNSIKDTSIPHIASAHTGSLHWGMGFLLSAKLAAGRMVSSGGFLTTYARLKPSHRHTRWASSYSISSAQDTGLFFCLCLAFFVSKFSNFPLYPALRAMRFSWVSFFIANPRL